MAERGIWSAGVCANAPGTVRDHVIAMVEAVERFRHAFHMHTLCDSKCAAQPGVKTEEVESYARIAADDCSGKCFRAGIHSTVGHQAIARRAGALRGLLQGVATGGDVEWELRVVLQDPRELPIVREMSDETAGRLCGGGQNCVEDQAISLVVVRSAAIYSEVEVVDGRAEEELAYVVDGM